MTRRAISPRLASNRVKHQQGHQAVQLGATTAGYDAAERGDDLRALVLGAGVQPQPVDHRGGPPGSAELPDEIIEGVDGPDDTAAQRRTACRPAPVPGEPGRRRTDVARVRIALLGA